MEKIILASQSQQRKKILTELGIPFDIVPAHIDEHHAGYIRPHSIVQSIATRKAEKVAQAHLDRWVLAADTIVVLSNGQISLKPNSKTDAKQTIQYYSHSYCDVYTGVALWNASKKSRQVAYEKSRIHFLPLSDAEIDAYLKVGNWKKSSGALTLEEVGHWVRRIEGDYSNILGLPVTLVKKMLQKAS